MNKKNSAFAKFISNVWGWIKLILFVLAIIAVLVAIIIWDKVVIVI